MSLLNYIKGKRKGKEAHRTERESMQDPFLSEALDGYHSVEDNHAERIENMRAAIQKQNRKERPYLRYAGIAAGFLLVLSLVGYLFYEPASPDKSFMSYQREEAHEVLSTERPDEIETEAMPDTNLMALAEEKQSTQFSPPAIDEDGKVTLSTQAEQSIIEDDNINILIADLAEESIDLAKREMKIEGFVTDETGEPIIGASVLASKEVGTITDIDGYFKIDLPEDNDLEISYLGMESVTVPVDTSRPMMIAMHESKDVLSEVVITGYATSKQRHATGAVAQINTDGIEITVPSEEYLDYLEENKRYPTEGECSEAEGRVILTFQLNKKGRPKNIKVTESLCPTLDKEAIRLVKEGPAWNREEFQADTIVLEITF